MLLRRGIISRNQYSCVIRKMYLQHVVFIWIVFLRTIYLSMSHSDPRSKLYCCWIFHFFLIEWLYLSLEQVSRWWSKSRPGFHQGSQHDYWGRWSCQSGEAAVWEWRGKDGEGESFQIEGSSHPGGVSRGVLCQEFGAVCRWNYIVHEMSEMCISTSLLVPWCV